MKSPFLKKSKTRNVTSSKAFKVSMILLGVGLVAGTSLVITMNQLIKKIFVDEDWPEEEWSDNDWADEELEG